MSLMTRQDAHPIYRNRSCAFELEHNIHQSEREQAPFRALKRGRNVVKSKKESDHIISMCNDFDQAMIGNGHNVLNNKVNFTRCKRIVFPVIDKGIIVGSADAGRP